MTNGLGDVLRSSLLFSEVESASIEELVPTLRVIELADGEMLVSQGDPAEYLYILISGHLRAIGRTRNEECLLLEVNPGESVGEMAVFGDNRASATVVASCVSRVLALPRTSFDSFCAKYPSSALQVMQRLSGRVQRYRLAIALHLGDVFETIDANSLRDLEAELEMFTLYGGEILFRQGDPADFLCIVICGRVQVRIEVNGQETTVAKLGAGELVGEIAMVTSDPRTATVEAVRDTQLAKLTRASFERFIAKHPQPAFQSIARKLAQRLKETTAGYPHQCHDVSSIAIVPAHRGAPVSDFCEGLKSALGKFGHALHVSSSRVDLHLGREGIAQAYERGGNNIRLVEWLTNQEIVHDYVLYEADQFLSPWTERCIRQADILLIVGEGRADPRPGEIETELVASWQGRNRADRWLILMHREGNPVDTNKWLDARSVNRHFHVRFGQNDGFERVARFITGRALGLTLGGGFARGLAHVGVLRAFEDLGIPIDAIGGASMGAIVAALWSTGSGLEQIVEEFCTDCTRPLDDLTFPFVALKTGRNFSELVRRLFKDARIEDLWMPYFCISANLNRSELKVHTQGLLAKAVLAATRAPGVFPPTVYDGELHVDGAVINNVPVDIMKKFCNQGITVGVDVSPPHELNPVQDYGDEVSGWHAFWTRCNPFSKRHTYTPNLPLVMIRTLEFTGISYKALRLKYADVYMYPNLLKFKRTDYHRAPEIVNAGYECARSNMQEWLLQPSVAKRRPDLVGMATEQASSPATVFAAQQSEGS
jgi:lysophospholipid hydrolase